MVNTEMDGELSVKDKLCFWQDKKTSVVRKTLLKLFYYYYYYYYYYFPQLNIV